MGAFGLRQALCVPGLRKSGMPEALGEDGACKPQRPPGQGDAFEIDRGGGFFGSRPFFIETGERLCFGTGFLKQKLLAKRESGGNGSVCHRMRGFAEAISLPGRGRGVLIGR